MKTYQITENNITYDITAYASGDKYWYKNGKLHRETGPACEFANGYKYWYKNGLLHRDDGPAITSSGKKYYWFNGKCLTQVKSDQDLPRYIKLLSIS